LQRRTRRDAVLGERSGIVDAEDRPLLARVGAPAAAQGARPARGLRLARGAIADLQAVAVSVDRHDLAAELVPEELTRAVGRQPIPNVAEVVGLDAARDHRL